MRREKRRERRLRARRRERMASVDPIVEGVARGRSCDGCGLCAAVPPCGWRCGLLADHHAPWLAGVIMRGVILPGGDPVTRFCEVWPGGSKTETAVELIVAYGERVPVIVSAPCGGVISVLGPDAETVGFVKNGLAALPTVGVKVEPRGGGEYSPPRKLLS